MKDDQNNAFKLGLMILDSLNGSIDEARFTELDKMIINDPTTLDTYLEFIALHAILNQQGNSDKEPAIPFVTSDIEEQLRKWQELAEYEKVASSVEVERVEEKPERVLTEEEREAKIQTFIMEERALEEEARRKIRQRELRRRQRAQMTRMATAKIRRYLRNAAIAAMLMAIGFLVYVVMQPALAAPVATLSDGTGLKWADPQLPTQPDSLLRPGNMKLVEGIAQITFNEGAIVILEAPCEINLQDSHKAYLESGKLGAFVPLEARGFKINTPSSSIVDLGTEFGVHVKEDGSSDIHVFKGKVSLLAGRIDRIVGRLFDTVEQIVEAGQARRVVKGGDRIEDIALDRNSFVSKVAKTIPFAYDSTVSPIGRILYFPFDAINNKRVINRVSNVPIGRLIGRASVAMTGADDGKLKNEILELNGGCVHIDTLKDRGSRDGYTFVMWIRSDIINLQRHLLHHVFFAKKKRLENYSLENYSKEPLELELYMANDGGLALYAGSDKLRNRGLDFHLQVKDVELPAGSWFHVAAVVSPTLAQLYINGTPRQVQWDMPGQIAVELLSAGSWDILIGASKLSWDGSTFLIEEEFHGSVDDFTIFDKVLSQEEVTTLYLNTKNDR